MAVGRIKSAEDRAVVENFLDRKNLICANA